MTTRRKACIAFLVVLIIATIALAAVSCSHRGEATSGNAAEDGASSTVQLPRSPDGGQTANDATGIKEIAQKKEQARISGQAAVKAERDADDAAEAQAKAENTVYELSDTDQLEAAGVPAAAAAKLQGAFEKWCAKKKLDSSYTFDSVEVSKQDDGSATIPLFAEKMLKGGSETVAVTATASADGKVAFSVAK